MGFWTGGVVCSMVLLHPLKVKTDETPLTLFLLIRVKFTTSYFSWKERKLISQFSSCKTVNFLITPRTRSTKRISKSQKKWSAVKIFQIFLRNIGILCSQKMSETILAHKHPTFYPKHFCPILNASTLNFEIFVGDLVHELVG